MERAPLALPSRAPNLVSRREILTSPLGSVPPLESTKVKKAHHRDTENTGNCQRVIPA